MLLHFVPVPRRQLLWRPPSRKSIAEISAALQRTEDAMSVRLQAIQLTEDAMSVRLQALMQEAGAASSSAGDVAAPQLAAFAGDQAAQQRQLITLTSAVESVTKMCQENRVEIQRVQNGFVAAQEEFGQVRNVVQTV